ncbi:hypothetical protein N7539_009151 [Penicillium diatomitis]|uniref:Exosome complex protein n=1 Tax=Penicillium diatomitis TaxID=2819901 RepID=A0A9W9WLW5_9EURO|nr:uncharacterized protein N7539_009151 [Penicillium diatomitis]KAJ5469533.1 hypothetical protein N7539_009151 [Penicillium diatomitis]
MSMDTADLLPLLEQLDDGVDDLEDALQPLLGSSLNKMSKNMPILDKAKIHVLTTYAIETLIFNYLRLRGVDAKQHPVWREITRVRQYFDKMKELETEPEQRTMVLDKAAAGRFIKHGLAGNNKIDLERAEKEAKERARAQVKAALLAKKAAASRNEEHVSSATSLTAQTGDDADESDEEMNIQKEDEAKDFKTGEAFIGFGDADVNDDIENKKKKKTKAKENTTRARTESAQKQGRKATKAELRQEKKDRRQKKENIRKSRGGK